LHRNNDQHDFKGWGENQPIMLRDKTRFLTLTFRPVEKGFRSAWLMSTVAMRD